MSKIDDGGAAFPISERRTEQYMDEGGYARTRTVTVNEGGMSLLEYFAGHAPTEIPEWFAFDFDEPAPSMPFGDEPNFQEVEEAYYKWQSRRDRAEYFAWRFDYAIGMIVEKRRRESDA